MVRADVSVIKYTTTNGKIITPYKINTIDGDLISNVYEQGEGKMTFNPHNGSYLTTIGDSAFCSCKDITSITLPEGITTIGNKCFSRDIALAMVNLPSSIKHIGDKAFQVSGLKYINLPEGLETISFFSFGFSLIQHITIPSTVKELKTSCFECCYYLESIDLKKELECIGSYSFANCPSLKKINYNGTKHQWNSILKKTDWKKGGSRSTPLEVIHCIDGDISVDPWIVAEPTTGSASFTLSVSDAEWATMCAPLTTKCIHPNIEVYSIKSENNCSLSFTQEYELEAGKPYIVHASKGNYKIFGSLYDPSKYSNLTNGLLIGTFDNITIEDDNSYVLQKQGKVVGFYQVDNQYPVTISANKAYLKLSSSKQASCLSISPNHEDNLTHYDLVEEDNVNYLSTDNSEFKQRIEELHYNENIKCDWSDSVDINLPEPYCAYINITDGTGVMPSSNNENHYAYIELYDGNGNYLKKRVITNAQGSTSIAFDKKNFSADFCNDKWIGDDTPNIKFGHWVGQNSFHFKAYWIDYFRCVGAVGYKLFEQMEKTRGETIWQRVGHDGEHNKARCYPDGFPCAVYLNGKFEGIYSWQLKKHRKNMNMQKDEAEQIHLDGLMDNTTLLVNTINWKSFSVRNPKNLYTMDGKKYDINNPQELIDETSPYFSMSSDNEKIKKQKQRTAEVKKSIIALSEYYSTVKQLVKEKASNSTIKEKLKEQIDVDGFIDYYLLSLVTSNYDGFRKNWQWFTYDGKKWCIAPYDLDCTFGLMSKGTAILPADTTYFAFDHTIGGLAKRGDMSYVITYFMDEIKSRYAQLRNAGIFTTDNILSLINNWRERISDINYQNEWNRWPLCNCINETICNDNWEPYYDWSIYGKLPSWNNNEIYHAGDMVTKSYRIWRATETTTAGVIPYILAGYKDSIQRVNDWLEERISLEDQYLGYKSSNAPDAYSLYITASKWSTLCLPFSFSIPENLTVYSVTGLNESKQTIVMKEVTTTTAHKPYLVHGKSGYYTLSGHKQSYKGDKLVNGKLIGTYDTIQVQPNEYVLQNHNGSVGFYRTTTENSPYILPYRAYLSYSSNKTSTISLFNITEEEETSGIDFVEDSEQEIYYYNIDGTRNNSLHQGINVIKTNDGKTQKIIIQ